MIGFKKPNEIYLGHIFIEVQFTSFGRPVYGRESGHDRRDHVQDIFDITFRSLGFFLSRRSLFGQCRSAESAQHDRVERSEAGLHVADFGRCEVAFPGYCRFEFREFRSESHKDPVIPLFVSDGRLQQVEVEVVQVGNEV